MPVRHVEAYPHFHRFQLHHQRGSGLVDAELWHHVARLLLGEEAHVLIARVVGVVAVPDVGPPLLTLDQALSDLPRRQVEPSMGWSPAAKGTLKEPAAVVTPPPAPSPPPPRRPQSPRSHGAEHAQRY